MPALPLEPGEFATRGIYIDRERLLKPFINDATLAKIFGDDVDSVRREFLLSNGGGTYSLKPEFATQRQVEKYFASRSAGLPPGSKETESETNRVGDRRSETGEERLQKLKLGLFDLISDVILLEADGKLHFRFGIEQTESFKNLPPDQQTKLRDLYIDYFFRRQDNFWMREAMQKLPALKRVTNMLICGEDLGLVPACVPEVMRDLGFLSLEIQRMPKALGAEFSRPEAAPYLSVVTPATHDMSTIRGWWEEDAQLTQKFYNHELSHAGEAPRTAEPLLVQAVVQQHLDSPAMWSIFQWQDLVGMDASLRRDNNVAERINIPAYPNYYWRYRLHLTLEKLMEAEWFNSQLRQMLAEAGR